MGLGILSAVNVEIFFANVINPPYLGTQHKKYDHERHFEILFHKKKKKKENNYFFLK